MTRNEYLQKLQSYLRNLPPEEVEDVLVYYRELFDEKNLKGTDSVPQHLESPRQVALDVLAEVNLRQGEKQELEPAKSKKNSWLIILLALFAAPIGLPFAMAILGLLIGLISIVFAILFALFTIAIVPILVLFQGVSGYADVLFLLGLSLVGIGLLSLFLPVVPKAFGKLSRWISKKVHRNRRKQ